MDRMDEKALSGIMTQMFGCPVKMCREPLTGDIHCCVEFRVVSEGAMNSPSNVPQFWIDIIMRTARQLGQPVIQLMEKDEARLRADNERLRSKVLENVAEINKLRFALDQVRR